MSSSTRGARRRWLQARTFVAAGAGIFLSLVGIVAGGPAGTPAQAATRYTCKSGFVWREAYPADLVCVPPGTRTQSRSDNAAEQSRRQPGGGASGPDTCKSGFVWREAIPSDHVCVITAVRTQTASDNLEGVFRLADPANVNGGPVTAFGERHQLGGYIYAQGSGTPGSAIHFYAVNPFWKTGLFTLGRVTVPANGRFGKSYVYDARCLSGLNGLTTIVSLDPKTGLVFAAGGVSVFSC